MDWKSKTALLLGTFTDDSSEAIENYFTLTETAGLFDFNLKGAFKRSLVDGGRFESKKTVKFVQLNDPLLSHHTGKYGGIFALNLGPANHAGGLQSVGAKFRNLSKRVIGAIKYLSTLHYSTILVESFDSPKVTGTSVAFALHLSGLPETRRRIRLFEDFGPGGHREDFERGQILAEGQIAASDLAKSSSAQEFVEKTKFYLQHSKVGVIDRGEPWIRERNMAALLSVAATESAAVVLELTLKTTQAAKPLLVVGKGTAFESNLLGDRPQFYADPRRSGMGGAACIVGALLALSRMQKAPLNIHCVLALVWNEEAPKDIEDGHVVQAMNGATIEVQDVRADSRLVLADVLTYALTLDPCAVLDVATMSSNADTLVGNSCSVFFTSESQLQLSVLRAAEASGDKVWQLPLVQQFQKAVRTSRTADLSSTGSEPYRAVIFKAASFLGEFVRESVPWLHVDASAVAAGRGTKEVEDVVGGKPTRLVAEFCLEFFRESGEIG